METIIKINPSELDQNLLDKIKNFIGNKSNVDVTISLKEFDAEYANTLNRSIEEAEQGDEMAVFTMDSFMEYTPR